MVVAPSETGNMWSNYELAADSMDKMKLSKSNNPSIWKYLNYVNTMYKFRLNQNLNP